MLQGRRLSDFLVLSGSQQLYYHHCSGRIPGHTTRAPPVGCELEINCFKIHAIANLDKTSLYSAYQVEKSSLHVNINEKTKPNLWKFNFVLQRSTHVSKQETVCDVHNSPENDKLKEEKSIWTKVLVKDGGLRPISVVLVWGIQSFMFCMVYFTRLALQELLANERNLILPFGQVSNFSFFFRAGWLKRFNKFDKTVSSLWSKTWKVEKIWPIFCL